MSTLANDTLGYLGHGAPRCAPADAAAMGYYINPAVGGTTRQFMPSGYSAEYPNRTRGTGGTVSLVSEPRLTPRLALPHRTRDLSVATRRASITDRARAPLDDGTFPSPSRSLSATRQTIPTPVLSARGGSFYHWLIYRANFTSAVRVKIHVPWPTELAATRTASPPSPARRSCSSGCSRRLSGSRAD